MHALIDVAIVDKHNTLSLYELLINAIVTPNNERDQFYNKYGVNLELTRNIALQTYAEFYRRTDYAGKINTIEDIYKANENAKGKWRAIIMNYAIYTGRITKDLQLKQTQSGRSVLSFDIAVQRDYKTNRQTNMTQILYRV